VYTLPVTFFSGVNRNAGNLSGIITVYRQ
jgi:hypothetical protein